MYTIAENSFLAPQKTCSLVGKLRYMNSWLQYRAAGAKCYKKDRNRPVIGLSRRKFHFPLEQLGQAGQS